MNYLSEFTSNVLKLISGTLISQILGILLVPIISRLYTPEDYGLFTLILSVTSIITIFSTLSYQFAIMLPKDDDDAANIVALCLILNIFASIICGIVFFLFANPVALALNTPKIAPYLLFIPIITFLTTVFSIYTYWNSRRKRFGVYAIAQVSNSISSKPVQIVYGITSPSPFGLIIGYVTGYICAATIMLKGFYSDWALFRRVTKKRIITMAKRYKEFPLFNSWSSTANTISTQATPLIFTSFFGPTIVGYFAMGLQIISMPLNLVGNAIGQVFFQRASEEKNKTGNIKILVQELHQRLFKIGIFRPFF